MINQKVKIIRQKIVKLHPWQTHEVLARWRDAEAHEEDLQFIITMCDAMIKLNEEENETPDYS